MALRPRLIPVVIVAATVLLGLKVSDIFAVGGAANAQASQDKANGQGKATGAPVDLAKQANATKNSPTASTQPKPQAGDATPPAANSAANKSDANTAAPQQTANAPQPAAGQNDAKKPADDARGSQEANAIDAGAPSQPQAPPKDPLLLSPSEIQILQQLSARRADIDKRASVLDQQQVVLQAAEKRVDEKIAKLQQMQDSIQAAVDKEKADDDARTQSLVKIYETMKPKDAASIMGQLDMPIVLQLLNHMKESKTAPILAAMDPSKAQAITAAMAQKPDQAPLAAAPKS